MRNYILLFVVISIAVSAGAQSQFTLDEVSQKVVCKQVFLINATLKVDSVYTLAQRWLSDSTKVYQKNADPPIDTNNVKKMQQKYDIDRLFENPRPLQTLDPERRGMVGMGIIKYYGNAMNSIKLLYLRYDIYITVKEDSIIMTISNIHYYHFTPKNYTQLWLYNFSGSKPCDEKGKLEELMKCEDFHTEFRNLARFFNREVFALFIDFRNLLRYKKLLYDPNVPVASPDTKIPKRH